MSFRDSASLSFRTFCVRLCLVGSLLFGNGCSIGESKKAKENLSVEARSNLGCLNGVSEKLSHLTSGKGSVQELDALEQCTVDAVKEFSKLTMGKEKNTFSPAELRDFLQKYYLAEFKVSDRLLGQFLRVKESYFGGTVDRLDAEDLTQFLRITKAVFSVFRDFLPDLPFSLEKLNRLSPKAHAQFTRKIENSVQTLTQVMRTESKSPYTFSELEAFLGELDQSLERSRRSSTPGALDALIDRMSLFRSIKATFVGDSNRGENIPLSDVKVILADSAILFSAFLKGSRAFSENGMNLSSRDRDFLFSGVNEGIDLLQVLVERHQRNGGEGIPLKLITKILLDPSISFDQKGEEGVPESDIHLRPGTLSHLVEVVSSRLLSLEKPGARGKSAITQSQIEGIRKVLREWFVLKSWSDFSEAGSGFAGRERLVADTAETMKRFQKSLPLKLSSSELTLLKEYQKFLGNNPALFQEDSETKKPRAIIAPEMKDRNFLRFELNLYSLLRPLLGTFIRGYAEVPDGQRLGRSEGLTLPEFELFVRDVWDLLIDLKFLSKKNRPELDAAKRFREASLFCFSSDGDEWIGVDEASQLILYLAEAKSLSKKVNDLVKVSCLNGDRDEFGVPAIEPTCYRRYAYDFDERNTESQKIWADFPKLMAYYSSLTESEKADFRFLIEIPARVGGFQEKAWFSSTDTETYAALMRYIETIFERFDQAPKDGVLGPAEARLSFPLFRRELSAFRPDLDSATLYAAFAWMLAHGGEPVTDQMGFFRKITNGAQFLWWKRQGDQKWKFESTRRNLVSIFGVISQSFTPARSAGMF
jgi:hypothetical protein